MTLLHLRYFCAVAKYENMNRAAKELYVSQPALSKAIHALEEELGTALFFRNGRNVQLSHDGRFFYDNVSHCLAVLDNTVNTITNKTLVKEIRICVNSGNLFMEEAIAEYRQLHEDVFFLVHEGQTTHLPSNSAEFDLAVYTADTDMDLEENERRHVLLRERFGIGVPNNDPAYTLDEIDLLDMQDRHFIATNIYGANYQFCREAGFTPRMAIIGQQLHCYLKMLEYSTGVSVMPEITFGAYLPDNFRFIRLKGKERTRTIIIEETLLHSSASYVKDFVAFCLDKGQRMMNAVKPTLPPLPKQ